MSMKVIDLCIALVKVRCSVCVVCVVLLGSPVEVYLVGVVLVVVANQ